MGYLDISLHAEKELVSTIALLQSLVELIEDKLSRLNFDYAGQRVYLLPSLPPEIERELTLREREVLLLRLSGLKRNEIAQRLHLSPLTVKTHCQNTYEKLRIGSISELRAKLGW